VISTDPLFSVAGKVVVVTGGMGQLGRRFAHVLSERGARVAVLDQSVDQSIAAKALPMVAETGIFVSADVRSKPSLEEACQKITASLGSPHVLVNNAAIDSPPGASAAENGPFEDFPEAVFSKVMDVNVKGVVLASQVFGKVMASERRGSIINISSIYGMVSPDQSIYEFRRRNGESFFKPVAYSVSKSALLNLSRYLAVYWASRTIRVNTLTFAGVFNNQDPEFLARYCPKVPLGRMAMPEDYVGALVFLASDASAYMTGSNLVVDGGYTAL